jgi:hypothetical protein
MEVSESEVLCTDSTVLLVIPVASVYFNKLFFETKLDTSA